MTEAAPRINWTALSPEAQDTIRRIVLPVHFGYSHPEIAAALGCSAGTVTKRLTELRREIRAQLHDEPATG
jgi:DNA-directed RNA polymerase specialized sigma24 family protein